MLKKITTIIATNHKVYAKKAIVMGGVVLGIGIGLLLNKTEDPDLVIVEEVENDDDAVESFVDDGEKNDD